MQYTQQDLDNITEAIALGVREVYTGDKRVVYRSLQEMRQIRAEMIAQLTPPGKPQRKWPTFSKFPPEE